jgi:hypothetical protein
VRQRSEGQNDRSEVSKVLVMARQNSSTRVVEFYLFLLHDHHCHDPKGLAGHHDTLLTGTSLELTFNFRVPAGDGSSHTRYRQSAADSDAIVGSLDFFSDASGVWSTEVNSNPPPLKQND